MYVDQRVQVLWDRDHVLDVGEPRVLGLFPDPLLTEDFRCDVLIGLQIALLILHISG